MDRRTQKARRIYKDMQIQDVEASMQDVGAFLDEAADMADETGTYPGFGNLVELENESDEDFEEGRRRHDNLTKALAEYLDWWSGDGE